MDTHLCFRLLSRAAPTPRIYATLQAMDAQEGRSTDLLICCGDFQVRLCHGPNTFYHTMESFRNYYSGKAAAPYPTIF